MLRLIPKKIEKIMINQLHDMDNEFNLDKIESDLNATDYKKHNRNKK